jgi:hypothetical protein
MERDHASLRDGLRRRGSGIISHFLPYGFGFLRVKITEKIGLDKKTQVFAADVFSAFGHVFCNPFFTNLPDTSARWSLFVLEILPKRAGLGPFELRSQGPLSSGQRKRCRRLGQRKAVV